MILARRSRKLAKGFTAVELMVVVAIAAILTAIALPNLRTYILNARRDSLVDGLVASMNYTRNQALNLDENVYLCPGTSTPSSTTCPGGAAWSTGWEAIATPVGGSTASLLATHSVSSASTTPAITATFGSTSLEFSGGGLVTMQISGGTVAEEVFVVCDSRGASSARAVEINAAGYIQSSSATGLAPDGTALACTST
jgi:type IV fimbrial biogenesis protein FimT